MYPDDKANDSNEYLRFNFEFDTVSQGLIQDRQGTLPACNQVSLLILMLGNLLEKSLALAAILTATWRATAL